MLALFLSWYVRHRGTFNRNTPRAYSGVMYVLWCNISAMVKKKLATIRLLFKSVQFSNREKSSTDITSLIARFTGPTWHPSGADRTKMGPMLAPWTLLSGLPFVKPDSKVHVAKNGAHLGPTGPRCGLHVGHMNLAIWVSIILWNNNINYLCSKLLLFSSQCN